jgi:hypothetical protein
MPTSVLAVVTLSVLLGFLVINLHWVDSHRPDSTAADHTRTETVARTKHIDFPPVRWNINHGSGA